MRAELLAIALGLGSAGTWGAGDFCGGLSARRLRAGEVAVLAQVAALVLLGGLTLALGPPRPSAHTALWAGLAGIGNGVGMLLLYAALGRGVMSVAAPVAALFTAAVPVVASALLEGVARPPPLAGFALAAGAIWLVAQQPADASGESPGEALAREGRARTGLWLAIAAGLGFGSFLLCMKLAAPGEAELPAMALSRAASMPVLLGAWWWSRRAARPSDGTPGALRSRLLACAAGGLDALGNTFFLGAIARGRLDVSSVLSALYPVSTVVLARVVLGERPGRLQQAGLGLALGAVVLIAL